MQESDPTREQPELEVQRVQDAQGNAFQVSGDPESIRFPYKKGDDTDRKRARKQAEERREYLILQAPAVSVPPSSTPPAETPESRQGEEPEMARDRNHPNRSDRPEHLSESSREGGFRGWMGGLSATTVFLGIIGMLALFILVMFAKDAMSEWSAAQEHSTEASVSDAVVPAGTTEAEVDEVEVDLSDPSTFVVGGGLPNSEEAIRVANNLGLGSVDSCNFFAKEQVVHLLAAGVMPSVGDVQYVDGQGNLRYTQDNLVPEDYFHCYTEDGVDIWLQAKCGNHVKFPPPPPPKENPEKFWIPVEATWRSEASCPDGTHLKRFTVRDKDRIRSTGSSYRDAFIEAYFSEAYYELARQVRDEANERADNHRRWLLDNHKCGSAPPPDDNPPPHYPPQPHVWYGTGSATWQVDTGNLCAPNGTQAASRGTVTVNTSNLYGSTAAAITSYSSQNHANTLAQAIAEAQADEIERQKRAQWRNDEDEVCDPQSQPSWAEDRIRADDDEDDDEDHDSDEGEFTVTGSDEPDRDEPDEDDYDDPVQGTNPEPRDDDDHEGYDEDPPPDATPWNGSNNPIPADSH